MKGILVIAGLYHIIWGLLTVFKPNLIFLLTGMDRLSHPFVWQLYGMLTLVFGLGFLIASLKPFQFWPVIFIGFIAKLFTMSGFVYLVYFNVLPIEIGIVTLFNDFIWSVPFALILFRTYQQPYFVDELLIDMYSGKHFSWEMFETNMGNNLKELTEQQPTMVVFLRHFGCTFCREALNDIAERKSELKENGIEIVLVHMLEDEVEADLILQKFGLSDIQHISDPESILYKMFKLKKGTVSQLFGLRVWLRGLKVGLLDGHGIGKEKGDVFQMPGVFYLHNGQIVTAFVHQSAADRPCYKSLTEEALQKIKH